MCFGSNFQSVEVPSLFGNCLALCKDMNRRIVVSVLVWEFHQLHCVSSVCSIDHLAVDEQVIAPCLQQRHRSIVTSQPPLHVTSSPHSGDSFGPFLPVVAEKNDCGVVKCMLREVRAQHQGHHNGC